MFSHKTEIGRFLARFIRLIRLRRKRRTKPISVYPEAVGSGWFECFNENFSLCSVGLFPRSSLPLNFPSISRRVRIVAAEGETIISDEKKREREKTLSLRLTKREREREILRRENKRSLFGPGKTEEEKCR